MQEWLGHPDIKMTANIYGHLDTKRKQGIAANMQRPLPAGLNRLELALFSPQKAKKIKPPSSFKLSGSALKNSAHCLVRVARVELTAS